MKTSFSFVLVFTFLITLLSCEKDDEQIEKETKINKETISAKWLVTNNSNYISFEFNENGNYIILENSISKSTNEAKIHIGPYEIIQGIEMTINCQDFGILEELIFESKTASFTLASIETPDIKEDISTEKAEEIEESEKTTLLAKSWIYNKTTWYDAEDGTTETLELPVGYRIVIAFTYYGTYTVFESYKGEELRKYLNWEWTDGNESSLTIWEQNQSYGESHQVSIVTLTEESFVSRGTTPDGDIVTEYYTIEPSGRYW